MNVEISNPTDEQVTEAILGFARSLWRDSRFEVLRWNIDFCDLRTGERRGVAFTNVFDVLAFTRKHRRAARIAQRRLDRQAEFDKRLQALES